MTDSILTSVKKLLGIQASYTQFDVDIIMLVNSALAKLNNIGIGPLLGFTIEDDEPTWFDFLNGDSRLNMVKSYVVLSVRLVFDPPTTSYVLTAMKEQITEMEWRLNVISENEKHGPPMLPGSSNDQLDGGAPGSLYSGIQPPIYDGGKP